jgi:hypothetical protein
MHPTLECREEVVHQNPLLLWVVDSLLRLLLPLLLFLCGSRLACYSRSKFLGLLIGSCVDLEIVTLVLSGGRLESPKSRDTLLG